MNFIEASKMKDGTKFNLKEYYNYGYLYFQEGKVYSDKGVPQQASVDLIETTWEIVTEQNPMFFCMSCNKYLGFRGFCSKECHNNYYDDLIKDQDWSLITKASIYEGSGEGREYQHKDIKKCRDLIYSRFIEPLAENYPIDYTEVCTLLEKVLEETFGDLK